MSVVDDTHESDLREAAVRVRAQYHAVRLYLGKMPSQRNVSPEVRDTFAEEHGASARSIGIYTRLFSKDEPTVKRIRTVLAAVKDLWRSSATLYHPDPGIRLIKEEAIPWFDTKIVHAQEMLLRAAEAMYFEMPAIRERERKRQGQLYKSEHYGFDPREVFTIRVRYLSVEVPNYLERLKPEVYQRELAAAREVGMEICRKTESDMAETLFTVLDTLNERLEGVGTDGKKRIFRDGTATKVFDELEKAEGLLEKVGIGKGPLQEAFRGLKSTLRGRNRVNLPDVLRENPEFRELFKTGAQGVCDHLLEHAVPKPQRVLLLKRARARRQQRAAERGETQKEEQGDVSVCASEEG